MSSAGPSRLSFKMPPLRANLAVTGPTINTVQFMSKLRSVGLTADDLKPVDWRTTPIGLVFPKNQSNCGDCWAQSSTSALTDRFRIQKQIADLNLAPVITTQCVPQMYNKGCDGGRTDYAGQFFEKTGLVDTASGCPKFSDVCPDKCTSASLPQCTDILQTCKLGDSSTVVYKAKPGSTANLVVTNNDQGNTVNGEATVLHMKQELLNGPYCLGFFVPNDFQYGSSSNYKWKPTNGIFINGEYNDDLDRLFPDQKLGAQWADIVNEGGPAGHAVELVGWDIGDAGPKYGKIPYWIVKNSWGTDWCDGGYFRYAMWDPKNKLNSYLGLDVPVYKAIQRSTGNPMGDLGGELFGGGVKFDPDLNTGAVGSGAAWTPAYVDDSGSGSGSVPWGKIIGTILVVLVVCALVLLVLRLIKRSRSGRIPLQRSVPLLPLLPRRV